MLKNFISSLSEGKYGKVVKEFNPAKLSDTDRSSLSFQVNEKQGQYKLSLVLIEDADDLEAGENFEIQVAGERIYVPNRATFSIEHEREDGEEELEFQFKWTTEK